MVRRERRHADKFQIATIIRPKLVMACGNLMHEGAGTWEHLGGSGVELQPKLELIHARVFDGLYLP